MCVGGGPSGRSPWGVYSPALTRGFHGRAARCIWALVSQRGTYLDESGLIPRDAPGSCVGVRRVARSGPYEPPPLPQALLHALRPQVPALERAQPPLVCQVVMLWSRPGVRAGEPVRDPESRCSGAPLLTRKRTAPERGGPAAGGNRAGGNHRRVKHGRQFSSSKYEKICGTGSGPSGLGMM